jgi:hypothetical protein
MSSKTEIVNMALTSLSARTITSLNEGSVNANIAKGWYPRSLKFCLNKSLWTFATKRVNLTQYEVDIPWSNNGMDFAYAYPNDRVRIFNYDPPRARIREEAAYIISDSDSLGAAYVFFNDNPESYTAEFEEAFAVKLAADMSFAITTDESIKKEKMSDFQSIALPEALSINSQHSTPVSVIDDEWLRVKNGAFSSFTDDLVF